MNKAVALGFRTRSETQKDPIAAIIGINMVAVYVESSCSCFSFGIDLASWIWLCARREGEDDLRERTKESGFGDR